MNKQYHLLSNRSFASITTFLWIISLALLAVPSLTFTQEANIAVSSTDIVAFGATLAGIAASLSLEASTSVQKIEYSTLRERLMNNGQKIP